MSIDSFGVRRELAHQDFQKTYYSLPAFAEQSGCKIDKLPFCIKVLLENLLRSEDGVSVKHDAITAVAGWNPVGGSEAEIAFHPSRVVLQDFTGVPVVVDFAAMRDSMAALGGDPVKINPMLPAELVVDHSVQVDYFGTPQALEQNIGKEFERNSERYQLLQWGQESLDNFKVVPPGKGIVHQVNLEYLARVVCSADGVVFPDTLVGTDSHTTMVNGVGVVGWGVGGIEAEAAMLGQPVNLLIPEVVGVCLTGTLPSFVTATDLVLTIVELLRKTGVVGKFVEFYGDGLSQLTVADRATIANMSPEFGSTIAVFPIDNETLRYLRFTGRSDEHVDMVEAYCTVQGLLRTAQSPDPHFSAMVTLDLSSVVPSLAGPRRPQDRVSFADMPSRWPAALALLDTMRGGAGEPTALAEETSASVCWNGSSFALHHGAVVIAAITSCTNTSNPAVMMGAGLLARNAVKKGLQTKPWVKSSLAPGSRVVTAYLTAAGLMTALEELRFHLVGYGCTTCIGNSGPLPEPIAAAVTNNKLIVAAVLSGNRNFEGRINPLVGASYLGNPMLVIAYALAGRIDFDFEHEPLGHTPKNEPVFLRDIWPAPAEIAAVVAATVSNTMFECVYRDVFSGSEQWRAFATTAHARFDWGAESTYIRKPTFFDAVPVEPLPLRDIVGARVLALLGDSVTTDHISPAGAIAPSSAAGLYLQRLGVSPEFFNSYGSRRGNHEVMVRGTFANSRLRNMLVPETIGGTTRHLPSGVQMSIFAAAERYQKECVDLIIIAGSEYGIGSSRDWAAKGTSMLGVRAVIAASFERIHRSNLIGMGVLPLQFQEGETALSLGLTGVEVITIGGIADDLSVGQLLPVVATVSGTTVSFEVDCRLDTMVELAYYNHGGILPYVLRKLR